MPTYIPTWRFCHWFVLPITYLQKQPPEVFCKKRYSWKSRKIHRETPVSVSLFHKSCRPTTLLKKGIWHRFFQTLAQVFSCEFWKISKSTFFTEYPWATASVVYSLFYSILFTIYLLFIVNMKVHSFFIVYIVFAVYIVLITHIVYIV